jgi:hypothetical protein
LAVVLCTGREGPGHPGERGEGHQVHAAGPGLQAQAGAQPFWDVFITLMIKGFASLHLYLETTGIHFYKLSFHVAMYRERFRIISSFKKKIGIQTCIQYILYPCVYGKVL